jgi:hypothetical protein
MGPGRFAHQTIRFDHNGGLGGLIGAHGFCCFGSSQITFDVRLMQRVPVRERF